MTTFTCNACHLEKETGQFYTSTKAKRGHHLICKECWDERTRKYRLSHWGKCYETRKRYRNRERIRVDALSRKSALKQKYGITPSEYQSLLESQGCRCAICGTHQDETRSRRLCVDHCHCTLRVRGLLCDKCNRGLGALNDDPLLLRKAAEYLEAINATLK